MDGGFFASGFGLVFDFASNFASFPGLRRFSESLRTSVLGAMGASESCVFCFFVSVLSGSFAMALLLSLVLLV